MAGDRALSDDDVRRLVDSAVNPFVVIDAGGTVVWAGASIEEFLGKPADELIGSSMLEHVAPESVEHAMQSLAAASEYVSERADAPGWEGMGPVVQLLRHDGATVSCSVAVATPVRTGMDCFVLQLRRSDAAYALENALIAMGKEQSLPEVMREVAAMLEGELPAADVAVLCRDESGELTTIVGPEVLCAQLAAVGLSGTPWEEALLSPGSVVERRVDDLPSPLRGMAAGHDYCWVGVVAVPSAGGGGHEALLVTWSRHPYPMHVFTHERLARCGSLVALVVRWERDRQALRWSATHDALTDLHNRSHFLEQLAGLARGAGEQTCAAVLYLDLDDFKPVNDLHGHHVGDQALREVARRLQLCASRTDVVARLGGDEFAVLCRGADSVARAERLAELLVAEVARPMVLDGIELQVGLSVGMAPLLPGDDPLGLLDRADTALRTAKVDGKRRWRSALTSGSSRPAAGASSTGR